MDYSECYSRLCSKQLVAGLDLITVLFVHAALLLPDFCGLFLVKKLDYTPHHSFVIEHHYLSRGFGAQHQPVTSCARWITQ